MSKTKPEEAEPEISAPEDLMREHGVLNRILLVYEAGVRRLRARCVRQDVLRACEAFIRMYRPHEAREDTILSPVLYKLVAAKEVAELGERLEDEEHQMSPPLL